MTNHRTLTLAALLAAGIPSTSYALGGGSTKAPQAAAPAPAPQPTPVVVAPQPTAVDPATYCEDTWFPTKGVNLCPDVEAPDTPAPAAKKKSTECGSPEFAGTLRWLDKKLVGVDVPLDPSDYSCQTIDTSRFGVRGHCPGTDVCMYDGLEDVVIPEGDRVVERIEPATNAMPEWNMTQIPINVLEGESYFDYLTNFVHDDESDQLEFRVRANTSPGLATVSPDGEFVADLTGNFTAADDQPTDGYTLNIGVTDDKHPGDWNYANVNLVITDVPQAGEEPTPPTYGATNTKPEVTGSDLYLTTKTHSSEVQFFVDDPDYNDTWTVTNLTWEGHNVPSSSYSIFDDGFNEGVNIPLTSGMNEGVSPVCLKVTDAAGATGEHCLDVIVEAEEGSTPLPEPTSPGVTNTAPEVTCYDSVVNNGAAGEVDCEMSDVDGDSLTVTHVTVDGTELASSDYRRSGDDVFIPMTATTIAGIRDVCLTATDGYEATTDCAEYEVLEAIPDVVPPSDPTRLNENKTFRIGRSHLATNDHSTLTGVALALERPTRWGTETNPWRVVYGLQLGKVEYSGMPEDSTVVNDVPSSNGSEYLSETPDGALYNVWGRTTDSTTTTEWSGASNTAGLRAEVLAGTPKAHLIGDWLRAHVEAGPTFGYDGKRSAQGTETRTDNHEVTSGVYIDSTGDGVGDTLYQENGTVGTVDTSATDLEQAIGGGAFVGLSTRVCAEANPLGFRQTGIELGAYGCLQGSLTTNDDGPFERGTQLGLRLGW